MKQLKFTRNKQLLAIVLSVLLVGGCGSRKAEIVNNDGDKVTSFKVSRYIRVNVDGVDCIVGAGTYDTTTAITCDWPNKSN